MTTFACWNCGTHVETVRGRTCACGAFYDRDIGFPDSCRAVKRWFWKCHHCGSENGPFPRRMDADDAAGVHIGETP